MILVWIPVFNELLFLKKTIDSILQQTYRDFLLVISDNHSTDGSSEIIDEACRMDSRVRKFSPPSHVPSLEHGRFIYSEILDKLDNYKYSIMVGGHDFWASNLLECLLTRAELEPHASIIYTDAYKVNQSDQVISKFEGIIHVAEVPWSLRPHHVLMGLTFNTVLGGLWREDKRKLFPVRHRCSGVDHLMIAEMSLHGSIIYCTGSAVYLRDNAAPSDRKDAYIRKHLSTDNLSNALVDFSQQLEWASYLIDKAVLLDPFCQQPSIKNMLKGSLLSAYICRYWNNLLGFEGGFEAFFNNQKILQMIDFSTQGNATLMEFLEDNIDMHGAPTSSVN